MISEFVPMRALKMTAILGLLSLAACGDPPKEPPITPAAPVNFTVPTGKVAVGPVQVQLPDRRGIGTYYRNYDCWVRVRNIMNYDFPSGAAVADQIRKTLTAAKLTVVPGSPASASDATGADYYLTAVVPTAHADLCINNFFNEGPADIDAQVALSWKLVSVKGGQTVYETNTSGTARSSDPNQKIDTGVYDAVTDATRQLLQTVTVQQYLTFGKIVTPIPAPQPAVAGIVPPGGLAPIPGTAGLVARPATLEPILIPVRSARPDNAAIDQAAARGALVTFTVPGGAGGAGFVLGEGYILTNASSLGDAVSVTIAPVPGKSVEAHVLRKDADRDLALLKVDAALPVALPLHPRRVAVGDKVYGVGANGVVAGTIAGTKAAGGKDQVKIPGASVGGPVVDTAGNVIGVLQPDGSWTSIGTVFRTLNLGAQLSDE